MAVTLKAKRIRGDKFTSEDLIEAQFEYTEVGTMAQCLTTIELVSGVDVTHGGGADAGQYLHYKAVEVDGDENGWIDYSSMNIQVQQEEKGESVIKIVFRYTTVAEDSQYEADYNAWSDAYQTITILADGTQEVVTAPDAPAAPSLTYTVIKSGEIPLEWSDDTFV